MGGGLVGDGTIFRGGFQAVDRLRFRNEAAGAVAGDGGMEFGRRMDRDTGLSAMDDRGRLYWTSDITKDWEFKQEPPAPGVYRATWIGPHYRWMALGVSGGALVWEYADPSLLFDIQASPLEVWSVAASPDSAKLAVAGKDPRIFIVDPDKKTTVRTLEGHTDGVTFVRFFQPDRLVSASDDKTIRLWDTNSGKLLKTVSGHESLVNGFAISPDRQWLVSVSSDHSLKLWKLPGLDFVKGIGATVSSGAAAAFLSDGRRLLTSDWTGNLAVYQGQPPDLTSQQQFRMSKGAIYMVCPSQDAWWAMATEGEETGLWLVPADDIRKAKQVTRGLPYYCSTSGDGNLTAIQYLNRIDVRSNATGEVVATYRYSGHDGAAVAIRDQPAMVVAGFGDGRLMGWPIGGKQASP